MLRRGAPRDTWWPLLVSFNRTSWKSDGSKSSGPRSNEEGPPYNKDLTVTCQVVDRFSFHWTVCPTPPLTSCVPNSNCLTYSHLLSLPFPGPVIAFPNWVDNLILTCDSSVPASFVFPFWMLHRAPWTRSQGEGPMEATLLSRVISSVGAGGMGSAKQRGQAGL